MSLSNAKSIVVDMDHLPGRYEDRYGHFMKVFEDVAKIPAGIEVNVYMPPWSWVPLLDYMGAKIHDPVLYFEHDSVVKSMYENYGNVTDRIVVEVLCGFRPETTDALWKCDMQWNTNRMPLTFKREFIVTNNGSFHRHEVKEYAKQLNNYEPTKHKAILVPCAADKPYPSVGHQMVLDIMPDDFYLMNATGVLGLVPMDLWSIMPHYDSGLPNEWRLMNTVADYFHRNHHERVVVYLDYYSQAIQVGLERSGCLQRGTQVSFVNPVKFYHDYLELWKPESIAKLKAVLDNEGVQ